MHNWNSLLRPDRQPSLAPLQVPGSVFFFMTETYFHFSYVLWKSRQTNHYCHLVSHMKDTINRPNHRVFHDYFKSPNYYKINQECGLTAHLCIAYFLFLRYSLVFRLETNYVIFCTRNAFSGSIKD